MLKYFRKIEELTHSPYVEYTPKTKVEKREAFSYTGQTGLPRFKKAIVRKISGKIQEEFILDTTRPKGSQFVVKDKVSGQRFYHIPGKVLLAAENSAQENGQNPNEYIEAVLEQYAEDAKFFLIEAGESYMWGSAGGRGQIADKISLILTNYSGNMFDANNSKSSYYGNWFKGVTGFTRRQDAYPMIEKGLIGARERREKYGLGPNKFRRLKDGSVGEFKDGHLLRRFYID